MVDFTIRKGQTLTLDIEAVNIGDQSGTQTIELKRNSNVIDSQELTISSGKDATTQLSFDSSGLSTGDYTLTAASADDSDSTTVTVQAAADSQFDVAITGTTSPVVEGERVFVSADITNSGDELDAQAISLSIDNGIGTVATSRNLPVASGETKSISLDWDTSEGDNGDYTATVSSDDDSATASIKVELDGEDTTGVTQDWNTASSAGPRTVVAGKSVYHGGSTQNDGVFVESRSISDGSKNWQNTSPSGTADLTLSGALYMHLDSTSGHATSINTDGSTNWTKSSSNAYDAIGSGAYTVIGRSIDNGGTDLIGLNTDSGDGLWGTSDPGDNLIFTLNVIGNSIYYTDSTSTLYRFNISESTDEDGNTTYSINDVYSAISNISPIWSDYSSDTLYLGDIDTGKIEARNLNDGTLNWSANNHPNATQIFGIVYHNNAIYTVANDNQIVATAVDGSEIWSQSVNYDPVDIAASGDKLFVAGKSDGLYAYDLTT